MLLESLRKTSEDGERWPLRDALEIAEEVEERAEQHKFRSWSTSSVSRSGAELSGESGGVRAAEESLSCRRIGKDDDSAGSCAGGT
jgi:hypothetical protein